VQARARQPSVEQEAVYRRSKLTDKQVATAAQPCVSPRHKPMLEVERILIIDFASRHARAKEVAVSTSREGGQTKAAATKPLSTSPLLTADGVEKMYC
jgi:hypothetical protein